MAKKKQFHSNFDTSFEHLFNNFQTFQKAKGVSEDTLKNYVYNFRAFAQFLDTSKSVEAITEDEINQMVVQMRDSGLSHNTISTRLRILRTFYNWCRGQGFDVIHIQSMQDKETVKETYTDEELLKLLKRPDKNCEFDEFRNWVIINFLMNSGCRLSTILNIQNRDVDLEYKQVIYRHNKNNKVQTIPLCLQMTLILDEYMKIRQGKPEDYLFCTQYGEQMEKRGFQTAIARYNHARGVERTGIHKFRHTFARKFLIDCGGDAFTLQKLLGHSTLQMTKRYCQIYDRDIANNYDAMSPLVHLQKKKEKIKK